MRSNVKTGDVLQIRSNGTNYICLGKVVDHENNEYIAATKNGNISYDGKMRKGTLVNSQMTIKPKIHVLRAGSVKRIHSNRTVDLESVSRVQGQGLTSHLIRTNSRTGVEVEAPNILATIREIANSI